MTVVLAPDLVLDADGPRRGVAVTVDPASGRITEVGPAIDGAVTLPGRVLMPGVANVHSHAFQRDLRGVVERAAPEGRDDFWTWRTAMYDLAGRLDPDGIEDVARRTYREMRAAGFTSVGEFHYVHHRPDGTPYDDPNELAMRVIAAAEAEGMRIVLLLVAYARAGAGRPPEPGQRRFCDRDVAAYLARLDDLRRRTAGRPLVSVGAAPHSVRAVPADWLEAIAAHCQVHELPLHIHACEQRREIEECLAEHGVRPVELLHRTGALGPRTVIVHGTHADAREMDLMADAGATVCACPATEADLGDGYVPAEALHRRGIPMAVGTDANGRIDPFAELRELELIARRTAERRNVLVAPGEEGPTPGLLRSAWRHGPAALGLPEARIAPGAPADLVALDLTHDRIAGVADAHLAAAIVFTGGPELVRETWIGGRA